MAPPSAASSLGDLYSKCVQMVNENKISAKNAWELPLIDHIGDIVDSFMGGRKAKSGEGSGGARAGGRVSMGGTPLEEEEENRFHEASCTIEASARIYACRVDCVHTDTYRVLGGLNSADMGEDDCKDGEDGTGRANKRRRICGVNTLEKNEASIIQHTLESDEQSDPTFRRMAAAFDAGGAKGLLLSHLAIAEDMSLVFNGDVPLIRAQGAAKPMFADIQSYACDKIGLGDPKAACTGFADARLCPEVDKFRQQLIGNASQKLTLPDRIEAIFGALKASVDGNLPLPPAGGRWAPPSLEDVDHLAAPFGDEPIFPDDDVPEPASPPHSAAPPHQSQRGGLALPLADAEHAIVAVPPTLKGDEDVIAFDELFQKFCSNGEKHQFAYFDECWSKATKDGKGKDTVADGSSAGAGGALVPVDPPKEKAPKRPLFDITGLGKPPRPIETEPVHKHQLSERAAQWQLHKDVPPYMIDRITMPSWPTWSKCDFACLGLRPHLMLKLVRKPMPETEGPHSFSDLFSTVVVENPEAFPWLAAGARGAAAAWRDENNADDVARAEREMEFGDDAVDDDDFGSHGGLPAHLDIDPQDLFLRPGDRVLPGGGGGERSDDDDANGFGDFNDMPDMGGDELGFVPDLDLDLVDRPATVGDTGIGYSRNSKFVDVKLVKKHLWDCINEDIEEAKEVSKQHTDSSFQELVDRTLRRLPKAETPNLSVAVCFICALHLCNEKNLELKVDPGRPLGDFAVVGSS